MKDQKKHFRTPITRDVFKLKDKEETMKNTPTTATKKLDPEKLLLSVSEQNSKYHSSSKKSEVQEVKPKRNLNKLFSNLNLSSSHQNFFNVINSVAKPVDNSKSAAFFTHIKMSEFVDIGMVLSNRDYALINLKKVVHVPSLKLFTVQQVETNASFDGLTKLLLNSSFIKMTDDPKFVKLHKAVNDQKVYLFYELLDCVDMQRMVETAFVLNKTMITALFKFLKETLLWVHNNGFVLSSLSLCDIFIQKNGKLKAKLDPYEIKKSMDNKLVGMDMKQVWDIRLIGLILFNCIIGEIFSDEKIDEAVELCEFCIGMKKNSKNITKNDINGFLSKYPHILIWIKNISVHTLESVYKLISGQIEKVEDLLQIDLFGKDANFLLSNDVTLVEFADVTSNIVKSMAGNVNVEQRNKSARFSSMLVRKLVSVLITVFERVFERWNSEDKAVYVLNWLQMNEQSKFIAEISHTLGISRRSVLSYFQKMIAKYKIDEKLKEVKKKYEASITNK